MIASLSPSVNHAPAVTAVRPGGPLRWAVWSGGGEQAVHGARLVALDRFGDAFPS